MRFLHIGDLHFGKSIYNTSMLEDQRVWAERFVEKVRELRPDAVVIAGDVYDRSQPSDEAMALFEHFVRELSETGVPVLITAGNHDSARKLCLHGALLGDRGIYFSGTLKRKLVRVTIPDEYGEVDFYLMPHLHPSGVRAVLEDEDISGHTQAAERLLAAQDIDRSRRNVLVAHQCVTNEGVEPERSGSETTIGGLSGIEYTAFDGFDYVALGHIHADLSVGRPEVRYCGTPMCYHFNETRQGTKGALLVELDADGSVRTEKVAIDTIHHLRVVCGTNAEVLETLAGLPDHTWVSVKLTDVRDDAEHVTPLRDRLYGADGRRDCLLLEHDTEKRYYREDMSADGAKGIRSRTVAEAFEDFYKEKSADRVAADEKDAALFVRLEQTANELYGDGKAPSDKAVDDILSFILKQEENAR